MKTIRYNNLDVFYHKKLNGGGMDFGQDYISVINQRYKRPFNYCYEFCCGPSFIGFSLLAHQLVKKLCLSDIYQPAIDAVETTVKKNDLSHLVDYYCIDGVGELPANNFDLVIANPPHFNEQCDWLEHVDDRIYLDEHWAIHEEFYHNIAERLNDDGIILIQENAKGSNRKSFELMICEAGLRINDVFDSQFRKGNDQIYYLEIMKKAEEQ
jgi:methylase of polypeptide subunit release factors